MQKGPAISHACTAPGPSVSQEYISIFGKLGARMLASLSLDHLFVEPFHFRASAPHPPHEAQETGVPVAQILACASRHSQFVLNPPFLGFINKGELGVVGITGDVLPLWFGGRRKKLMRGRSVWSVVMLRNPLVPWGEGPFRLKFISRV